MLVIYRMCPEQEKQEEGTVYCQTSLLFPTNDMYVLISTSALRGDHERRLRNVCITIYWLGRAAKGIADYKGPHLDESKFRELIAAHPVSGVGYCN